MHKSTVTGSPDVDVAFQVARRKRKTTGSKTKRTTPLVGQKRVIPADELAVEKAVEAFEMCRPQSPCEVSLASCTQVDDLDALLTIPDASYANGLVDPKLFVLSKIVTASNAEQQQSQLSQLLSKEAQGDDHEMIVITVHVFLETVSFDELGLDTPFLDQYIEDLFQAA